jgi:cytochrome b pre-mRNA-processing protein 3
VAQSRSVAFYRSYGVPDTVEGRFDLIVLHVVLLLAQLDRMGPPARALGQNLFDRFCQDLDANLREMAVGDLAVPKRMRQFGEAFYGRQAAYLAALNGRALEKTLARNIFQGVNGAGPRRLARYTRALAPIRGARSNGFVARRSCLSGPGGDSDDRVKTARVCCGKICCTMAHPRDG